MFDEYWWKPILTNWKRWAFIQFWRKSIFGTPYLKNSRTNSTEIFCRFLHTKVLRIKTVSATLVDSLVLYGFHKSSPNRFFHNFHGWHLWIKNRYESEILFPYASQLSLSTVKISASLSKAFGQETLNKIWFFAKTLFCASIS